MKVRNSNLISFSPSPPPSPYEGQIWYDGCAMRVFMCKRWYAACFDDTIIEELNKKKW